MSVDPSTQAVTEPCPVCGGRETLSAEIIRLNGLRAAQDPQGGQFQYFQRQIDELTAELIRMEEAAPTIARLDGEIVRAAEKVRVAHRAASRAENDAAHAAGQYLRPAATIGVVGGLLLIVGALFGLVWWLWAVVVLALLGAAGLVWLGIRARADAHDQVQDADEAVAEAEAAKQRLQIERQSILPVSYSASAAVRPRMDSALPPALVPATTATVVYDDEDD